MSTIDPIRRFEIKGQVCPLLCLSIGLPVGNNQLLITAVSGQRIRVMGLTYSSDAAGSGIAFRNGSAGSVIYRLYTPPIYTPMGELRLADSGYFETSTGIGLYADFTAAAASLNVFYITYTP